MSSSVPLRRSKDIYAMWTQGMFLSAGNWVTSGVYYTYSAGSTYTSTVTATPTVDVTTALRGDSINFNTSLAEITSDVSPIMAEYVVADGYSGSLTLYYTKTSDPNPLLTQMQSYDGIIVGRVYLTPTSTKTLVTYHVRGGMSSDGSGKGEQVVTLQLGSAGLLHTWQ